MHSQSKVSLSLQLRYALQRGPTVLLEGTDPPCPRIRALIKASDAYNEFLQNWYWLWDYLCYEAKTPDGSDFMEALNVAAVLIIDVNIF